MAFQRQLFQTTVPSSPRQSSIFLQIGGTSAMSPAAPTILKAMVLRSEWWRLSKRSSDRTTSSLPFCPTAQPPFPPSELALLSWLWEESSEPPCHHCHWRSSHDSLVTRKCDSVTQSWSSVRRKTMMVATECSLSRNYVQATQFSSKWMERRAGSCRERWWGNALPVHSWYRHQEVTCVGTADIWNRSLHLRAIQMTSVTRSQEESSPDHNETGALPNCVFWPAARCIPGWAARDTSDRPTTITTAVSREHFIFINAAYTQVYSSADTVFSVYSHTRSHQIWPHHQ